VEPAHLPRLDGVFFRPFDVLLAGALGAEGPHDAKQVPARLLVLEMLRSRSSAVQPEGSDIPRSHGPRLHLFFFFFAAAGWYYATLRLISLSYLSISFSAVISLNDRTTIIPTTFYTINNILHETEKGKMHGTSRLA
jgi:hypothetical protein